MSLYSPYWYRVAEVKPRLRSHVRIYRHNYRNQNWYILQDPSSSRQHRFSETAYFFMGLMDGEKTVQQLWQRANEVFGDDAPTQDEAIRLLARLHTIDVLQSDIPVDSIELLERQTTHRKRWTKRFSNPFALKFPLFDPERFLQHCHYFVNPLISRSALIIWVIVVLSAVVLAAENWQELTNNMVDRVLQPENLFLLWLVYPLVKLLHELGHAFSAKKWGGEVHEMGIMLLAFTPIPYVDASSSSAFPNKGRRMAVAAAGMAVELFVASLALILWLNVESGKVSAIAYNVMLIGSVSTLFFNGNPLLRYDGYYVLSDWLEIPNLATRSTQYIGYLCKRYIFAIDDAVSPATEPGERKWFVGYGILSFIYRLFILAVLAIMVTKKFFAIGILIALWACYSQVFSPAVKNMCHFLTSISGGRKRSRVFVTGLLLGGIIFALLFILPAPLKTKAEGVIAIPEYSQIRAGTECFVADILSDHGSFVFKDEPVIRCQDPFLDAEVGVLKAEYEEAKVRFHGTPLQLRVKREILKEKIEGVKADLLRANEKRQELIIPSPAPGLFLIPHSHKLQGRFLEKGTLLGYTIGESDSTVVVVVEQSDISLVRQMTKGVELRRVGDFDTLYTTTIDRVVPAASDYLPSKVLGTQGGGVIPVDPADPEGIRTFTKIFWLEIKLPLDVRDVRVGERVYAVLDHGYEPLAMQWYRMLRKLFLRHLYV